MRKRNILLILARMIGMGKMKCLKDETAVRILFRAYIGKELDLKNPKTFNEKMQWIKLYDRKDLYSELVDKHEVRKYIKTWIGEEYLVPELGLYDCFEDIDFQVLPDKFVLKCTHDSGSTIVCRDKKSLDILKAGVQITKRMSRSHYWGGYEWPYKNVKPRIIIEQYLDDGNAKGLTDYKFYCFNGEPKFLYISSGLEDHSTAYISFFDLEGKKMEFRRNDYAGFPEDKMPIMPPKFGEMIQISGILAKKAGGDFVRIDLYEVDDHIFFSEFTFTPSAGYMVFDPEEYDLILGEMLTLHK